jgi:hypothetical protein
MSKWKIEERKACVIIVIPSGSMGVGARILNFFLLEGLEMLEENPTLESEKEDLMEINVEENPEISLHAIIGNNHPNTMRLIGWVGNHKIIVLVDSGSTYNFLDSSMGRKLKVSISREHEDQGEGSQW